MSMDDRPNLEGVPENLTPQPRQAAQDTKRETASGPSSPQAANVGFDFNNPTVISLLYLSSFLLGFTGIVGVVLAYVWRGEAKAEWEASHYQYLINTFWIGFVGFFAGFILMFVLIGFLVLPAVAVLVIVRSVLSIVNAQKQAPMPNPGTLLA